jgi:hypothetical protein
MKYIFITISLFFFSSFVWTHPTGNMVYTGEMLLWSYVCPVGNSSHIGCVMTWSEKSGVKPWLVSEHGASDWMMSLNERNEVYLLERHYDVAKQKHRIRLLKGKPFEKPVVLWDWFDDTYRLGEGGFVMLSDNQILFARYPHLLVMRQDHKTEQWQAWSKEVNRVRLVEGRHLLIQGDDTFWLTSLAGEVQAQWSDLLDHVSGELPFMGNRIFDASYHGSKLWLAYWGQRRFDVIEEDNREIMLKFEPPFLPHAVATGNHKVFFLASSLDPDNAIRPQLWIMEDKQLRLIWNASEDN